MPKLKHNVNANPATAREVWYAIGVFDALVRVFGDVDGVVTSLNDGTHGSNSLHYADKAADIRSHHLTPETKQKVLQFAERILNPQGFDVILEQPGKPNEHFHCEFDPKPEEEFLVRT